jgi:putative Holliday junction resolvase
VRDHNFFAALQAVIEAEDAGLLVVGLPRNLAGHRTDQTETTEAFAAELASHYDLPVRLQDEAVTSRQAEAELEARGKPYKRADIDALAATYILEDFLADNQELASQ